MLRGITTRIISDALTQYQIGGHNLLKNVGTIKNDQEAHTDYADRLPK